MSVLGKSQGIAGNIGIEEEIEIGGASRGIQHRWLSTTESRSKASGHKC